MSHSVDSKQAQAYLIDPLNQPEPSAETGPGSSFGNTFAPVKTASPVSSTTSNNPFRQDPGKQSPTSKSGAGVSERAVHGGKESFPQYRAEAFGDREPAPRRSGDTPPSYEDVAAGSSRQGRRRTSSLKERFPGDNSGKPLEVLRKDSRKAQRSPHLNKRHLPGADLVDRLDPAIGGRAYHHEGPYDAASMARNNSYNSSPIAALESSNREALKATPKENIKDAVERHQPLDGVAIVPPGVPDRLGRTYNYEEGADLMHEGTSDAGYKRYPGKDYDPEDLKGQAEPGFSLDRALQAHKIDDNGIEMEDRAHIMKDYHKAERNGTLDRRDPVEIAGDDRRYAELEHKNAPAESHSTQRSGNLRENVQGLKKRIGSLRHKKHDD